jgi:hypothetical protein
MKCYLPSKISFFKFLCSKEGLYQSLYNLGKLHLAIGRVPNVSLPMIAYVIVSLLGVPRAMVESQNHSNQVKYVIAQNFKSSSYWIVTKFMKVPCILLQNQIVCHLKKVLVVILLGFTHGSRGFFVKQKKLHTSTSLYLRSRK